VLYVQVLVNGLVLGGLYSAIAVGFSLVWGVLNIINILHGSLIILGSYAAFFAYQYLHINPFLFVPVAALLLFCLGYATQIAVINRVMGSPVLITLTLTFGLNLVLYNLMILAFKADFRKVILSPPLGSINMGDVVVPADRLICMAFALALVGLLHGLLRASRIGRAIVAVRMDREAALLMGVKVGRIYAHHFRARCGDGRGSRQSLQRHLPDLARVGERAPGQGLRDLHSRRTGQRARRGGRRRDAGCHRELCRTVLRS
jgi:branched-chain amino acid transport system permease protein